MHRESRRLDLFAFIPLTRIPPLDGFDEHSSPGSTVQRAQSAALKLYKLALKTPTPKNTATALFVPKYSNVLVRVVADRNGFRDTPTCGDLCKRVAVVSASGPTALACSAAPLAAACAGYGTTRILSGSRCFPSTESDGSTSTLSRSTGTSRCDTRTRGRSPCLTALPFRLMEPPMSRDAM